MVKRTVQEIKEISATFIESGVAPAWFAESYKYTLSNLESNIITEGAFTDSIVGSLKSLGPLNPLSRRNTNPMSSEMTARVAEHQEFLGAIAAAFDLIPEGFTLLSAKKSNARPTSEYKNGEDWASVINNNIVKSARDYDRPPKTAKTAKETTV
tara:strand:+ start:2331 stop:2792 length:462 start_codon:yes stop_codon:yes gene_type:complete